MFLQLYPAAGCSLTPLICHRIRTRTPDGPLQLWEKTRAGEVQLVRPEASTQRLGSVSGKIIVLLSGHAWAKKRMRLQACTLLVLAASVSSLSAPSAASEWGRLAPGNCQPHGLRLRGGGLFTCFGCKVRISKPPSRTAHLLLQLAHHLQSLHDKVTWKRRGRLVKVLWM